MRRPGYHRLRLGLLSILPLYAAIGVGADRLGVPEKYIFPVSAWPLFARVPGPELRDHALKIVAINGEDLEAPLYYQDCGTWFRQTRDPTVYVLTQRLGKALAAGDEPQASRLRRILEESALRGPRFVGYEVVGRRSNLLEAGRSDAPRAARVLAAYTVSWR